jgi:pSer/pThr/pTyr-binding forkhead associated (FHA) protein
VVQVRLFERTLFLPAGVHEIGRRPDCAVSIDAASVSRVHARLHVGRGTLLLEDAGSKNGTFVAGQRIAEATPLPARSTVRIGDVEVTIERIGGALAETATLDPPA